MTVPAEAAPANSVPAAAVIRRGQALFGVTGRKELVGGVESQGSKAYSSTDVRPLKLLCLSAREVSGIPGVAVKCVDIGRNTSCEGG